MLEKKSVEAMKDDDELEMLLGEIPHATSSLNLHPTLGDGSHQQSSLVDLGYGHASFTAASYNGHRTSNVSTLYDDDVLRQSYACASSPASGFSLQSDGGSSSSLFSSGGRSMSDIGSLSPPQFEELKSHLISGGGSWRDFKKEKEGNLLDDFDVCKSFNKMHISDEQETALPPPPAVFQNCVQSCDRSVNVNWDRYGAASDGYRKGLPDCGGFNFNLAVPRGPLDFESDPRVINFSRSRYSPARSDGLFDTNSAFGHPFYRANMLGSNNFPMGFAVSEMPPTLNRPSSGDALFYSPQNGMNVLQARDVFYSRPNAVQLAQLIPHCNDENLMPCGRNKVPLHVRVPQRSVEAAFTREDSLIIQGEGVNYGMNRGQAHVHAAGHNKRGLHVAAASATRQDDCRSPKMFSQSSLPPKCNSLAEVHGYIYHIAKDQHGCRFLQRMFDEGTRKDVQIIFDEIIDHVVELMMNPFGNYLMQKLLEKCSEEQRMHILLRVTEDPGELVRISLNTHGTRVVQKLVETIKTKQQRSLVISALEPGFLALIKDLNGNHVIQRCLQCFTPEDSEFIFVAAAKYCVDIATHQHGCCVLQRCIRHATGKLQDNLVAEISANGLQLAQDAFGNYVVQFILEQKIPSATAKLTSQFEANYVHLSMQKFSSHVVEKCLVSCNDEVRSKIINELLSATYFEQLLQDPHANYVIQTALHVSEGPLHHSLVSVIESYKAISRNSPYSKRIFSHKLLKR